MWGITLHVAEIVTTEQVQHYVRYKHDFFQVHNCKYPDKVNKYNNNSNVTLHSCFIICRRENYKIPTWYIFVI